MGHRAQPWEAWEPLRGLGQKTTCLFPHGQWRSVLPGSFSLSWGCCVISESSLSSHSPLAWKVIKSYCWWNGWFNTEEPLKARSTSVLVKQQFENTNICILSILQVPKYLRYSKYWVYSTWMGLKTVLEEKNAYGISTIYREMGV